MKGERIAALEAIAPSPPDRPAKDGKSRNDAVHEPVEPDAKSVPQRDRERGAPGPAPLERAGDVDRNSTDRRPDPPARHTHEKTHEVELDLEL